MAIQSIKYWDSATSQKKNNSEVVKTLDKYQATFNSTLLDMLAGNKSQSMWDMAISGISDDPFSNSYDMETIDREIKRAKELGMEKVLAERLKAPLPFTNQNNYSNDYKSSSPLNRMTEITMQLQFARAKRAINRQNSNSLISFDEYIGKTKRTPSKNSALQVVTEKQIAKENLKLQPISNQIEDLAELLGLTYNDILKQLER